MPMPALQRAEKLLLKISADLRTVQMQAYQMQDDLAQRVHQKYCRLTEVSKENPDLEKGRFLLKLTSFVTSDETVKKLTLEGADAWAGVQKNQRVETPQTQVQGELTKLQTDQGQISGLLEGFRSMMQTHEAALQRLQQIESSAKN